MHRSLFAVVSILAALATSACNLDAARCATMYDPIRPTPTDYVVTLLSEPNDSSIALELAAKYAFTLDDPANEEGIFGAVLSETQANGLRCEPSVRSMGYNGPTQPD